MVSFLRSLWSLSLVSSCTAAAAFVWVGTVVGFANVLINCLMLGSGSDCRRVLDPGARARDIDVGMTLEDVTGVMCTDPAVGVDVVVAIVVSWCGRMPYSVRSIIVESFSMRLHRCVLCCCCCCCCCIIMFIISFIISAIMTLLFSLLTLCDVVGAMGCICNGVFQAFVVVDCCCVCGCGLDGDGRDFDFCSGIGMSADTIVVVCLKRGHSKIE